MDKTLVLVGIAAALVTWLFMYIDARLFDTPKSKFTYVKVMSFVAAVTVGTVYLMGGKSTTGSVVQAGGYNGYGGYGGYGNGTATVAGIHENILTGIPDF